jgi:hypothetical protein
MLGDVGKRMVVSPDIWQLMSAGSDCLPADGGRGNETHGTDARGASHSAADGAVPERDVVRGTSPVVAGGGTDDAPMDDVEEEDGDEEEQEDVDEEDIMDGDAS